jgi:hypothetical protein
VPTNDIVARAVQLGNLGFRVFPVKTFPNPRKPGKWVKVPAIPKDAGGQGFHDGTTDPIQIRAMFNSAPTHAQSIGLVHDHMTIVDADGQEGVDTLNRILPVLPPAAVIVRTISGSIHYYIPGTTAEGRDIRGLPGLDILTGNDKGFTVVPPSYGYVILEGSFEELAEEIDGLAGKTQLSDGTQSDSLGD